MVFTFAPWAKRRFAGPGRDRPRRKYLVLAFASQNKYS
jgi:hypothetical protein